MGSVPGTHTQISQASHVWAASTGKMYLEGVGVVVPPDVDQVDELIIAGSGQLFAGAIVGQQENGQLQPRS